MTPANIVMGFRATGVYPLNRYIVLQQVTNSDDSCEIDELATKMGMYVPLYSPAKNQHQQMDKETDDHDQDTSMTSDGDSMTESDIVPPGSPQNTQPSCIGEFFMLPNPPKSKNIYTAKVLTSSEHLRLIEEKEREKARKEEEKELRKQEREQKRDEKKRQLELKSKNKARKKSISELVFSNEEHKRFSKRQENGYDIADDKYCDWLRIFYPDDPLVSVKPPITSINADDNESSSDTDFDNRTRGDSGAFYKGGRGSKGIGTRGRSTLTQSTEGGGNFKGIGTRGRSTLTQSNGEGGGDSKGIVTGTRGRSTLTRSTEGGANSKGIGTRGRSTMLNRKGVIIDSSDNEISESSRPVVSKNAYCICRSGEFGKMIHCDAKDCKIGWWHFKCAGVEIAPVGKWFCRLCSDNCNFSLLKKL